ncbi:MAG TPA: malectin domain-containing carbohydrate-binding protein, partial [bacterium]|nr:malectin domain-containing carbohydrate-binding protein [bacterium]
FGLGFGLGLLTLAASAHAQWALYPCGRGGLCTGSFTPLPTATITQTPDPNAPTATPWPTPVPSATPFPNSFQLHLDVAASQGHTDANGLAWSADQAYAPGAYGFVDSGKAYQASGPVDLTSDAPLYQTFRQASTLHYQVDVAPGSYLVTLYFSEFIATAPGQRVLTATLQGVDQSPSLDLFALAQDGRAVTATYTVNVASGPLDIQVKGTTGQAVLSALSVQGLQAGAGLSPTPSPSPTSSPSPTPTPAPSSGGLSIQILQPVGAQLLP